MPTPVRARRIGGTVGARRGWRAALGVAGSCAGLAVAVAVACGGCTSSSGAKSPPRPVGPTYEVTTGEVSGLGTVLVDGNGLTLYLYVPDDHSSRSVCTGVCAVAWPPLLLPVGVPAALAGHGVNHALLGTTTRANGRVQVTYDGWPLYLWSGDSAPGQATGQGLYNLGGLWYVINPQGNPVH